MLMHRHDYNYYSNEYTVHGGQEGAASAHVCRHIFNAVVLRCVPLPRAPHAFHVVPPQNRSRASVRVQLTPTSVALSPQLCCLPLPLPRASACSDPRKRLVSHMKFIMWSMSGDRGYNSTRLFNTMYNNRTSEWWKASPRLRPLTSPPPRPKPPLAV